MDRILSEVRKVHSDISKTPNRYGREFFYTYSLNSFK